jgi:transposase
VNVPDVEILARVERRRVWSAEEKIALLAEIEAEGGKVRLVARRHRISESLLYNWRSAWRAAVAAMQAPSPPAFIPLGVVSETKAAEPMAQAHSDDGAIEIALPNGERIKVDTSVNEAALSRVLRAMKAAT